MGQRWNIRGNPFTYGVACYPEKHEEAPNIEQDLQYLKKKQELGASFAVTQLFYDNQKFYDFLQRARNMGITIPIVPGIKPFAKLHSWISFQRHSTVTSQKSLLGWLCCVRRMRRHAC